MTVEMHIGPLLEGVFGAQRADESATSYPELAAHCSRLEVLCGQLGNPVVWPVGPAAERLAGAAVLSSCGRIRLRGWTDRLDGERVLLLTVAAVTPIGLSTAAQHARAVGAREVHACGVDVQGVDEADFRQHIESYEALEGARHELEPLVA